MQIIIDIDEKYLECIHKAVEVDCTSPPYFVVQNLCESVLNGKPIPKRHGKIVDIGKIDEDRIDSNNPVISLMTGSEYIEAVSLDYLNDLETIVEANRAEDGDDCIQDPEESDDCIRDPNDCIQDPEDVSSKISLLSEQIDLQSRNYAELAAEIQRLKEVAEENGNVLDRCPCCGGKGEFTTIPAINPETGCYTKQYKLKIQCKQCHYSVNHCCKEDQFEEGRQKLFRDWKERTRRK